MDRDAVSCSLCLFHENMMIGVGSAREIKLDRSGDPDTLFYKARMFLANLPREFSGGFDPQKHTADMRLVIPETGSSITGEAGDAIGRAAGKQSTSSMRVPTLTGLSSSTRAWPRPPTRAST